MNTKDNTSRLECEMNTKCYATTLSGDSKRAAERSMLTARQAHRVLQGRAGLWLQGATLVIRSAGLAAILLAANNPAFAQTWTLTSAPLLSWTAVASSVDGAKLVAVANDYPNGAVYLSTNSGATWTPASAPSGSWSCVASSADGTRLVIAGYDSPAGPVYLSTNSGTSWTPAGISGHGWKSVASSASGSKLVMVADDYPSGPVFVSTDSGVSWAPAGVSGHSWTSVASSADGTKLLATANEFPTGPVFGSSDSGTNWTQLSAPAASWIAAASSADGRNLVIAGNNPPDGPVYFSSDSGTTWASAGAPAENQAAVALSADGTTIVVASAYINGVSGNINISDSSGTTWHNSLAPVLGWSSVAASADGRRLVATANGIYVRSVNTLPPLISVTARLTDGQFRLQFNGVIGGSYTVLTSSNLNTWTELGSAAETSPGQFSFTDAAASSLPKRFYRLRSPALHVVTNPGFETGDTTGWFAFGSPTISAQTSQVHSGSHAALVANRTDTWMGIAQEFQGVLQANHAYTVSAWLRLDSGANQTMQLTMKKTDGSGTTYAAIASGSVSANGWTQISGKYTLNYSGTLTSLILYAEMPSSSSTGYYLDDLVVQ